MPDKIYVTYSHVVSSAAPFFHATIHYEQTDSAGQVLSHQTIEAAPENMNMSFGDKVNGTVEEFLVPDFGPSRFGHIQGTANLAAPSASFREILAIAAAAPSLRRLFRTCLICLAVFAPLRAAVCETFTPPEEIRRQSEIFEPRTSFDTTPVTVNVAYITYRIPRNYLTHLEPAIPTLRVTYPGFKPLTEETRDCFDPKWRVQHPECTVIEFRLLGSRGPGPGGWAITNSDRFANFMRGLPVREKGRLYDYSVYEIGPNEAIISIYRRIEGDIYFSCQFSKDSDRTKGGVCNDMFRLNDMNHVQFYFQAPLIKAIPEVETRIRELLASFVVEERQP